MQLGLETTHQGLVKPPSVLGTWKTAKDTDVSTGDRTRGQKVSRAFTFFYIVS